MGKWQASQEIVKESNGPDQLNLAGGKGITLSVKADGDAVMDYTLSQPLQGMVTSVLSSASPSPKSSPVPTGPTSQPVSLTQNGQLHVVVHGVGGRLTFVLISDTVTGVNLAQDKSTTRYTCSAKQLSTVYTYTNVSSGAANSLTSGIVATITYTRSG